MIPLTLFLLACGAIYLGTIQAAFNALMRVSLRLLAREAVVLGAPLVAFDPFGASVGAQPIWRVGGKDKPVDVLLIVGGNDEPAVEARHRAYAPSARLLCQNARRPEVPADAGGLVVGVDLEGGHASMLAAAAVYARRP